MKILHTADWHIGKRLYEHELHEDHKLFFDWLLHLIDVQEIEVLLVSGDVFDLANPSSEARELYYNVLSRLAAIKIQVVLTGGNHDSPTMLNAPKELLNSLNIQVVGNVTSPINELIIPLGDKQNPAVVVAAVPFIRDNDLRKLAPAQSYEERNEAIKDGIKEVFQQAADAIKEQYPSAMAMAMGHLYAHGVSTSESEREIQIGNLAGFESSAFPNSFKYIALGHIHKPQKAGASHVLYSGSPIPLSFSEKKDEKRVLIIETDDQHEVQITSTPVPAWRKLKQLSGDFAKIQSSFDDLAEEETPVPTFIEVTLKLEKRDQAAQYTLENWVQEVNDKHKGKLQILKYRVQLINQKGGDAQQLFSITDFKELSPEDVFSKKLQQEVVSEEDEKLLLEAFQELTQEYNQRA